MAFDAAAKALVSVQHYSFYPIMAVARFNLYAQTLLLLATNKEIKLAARSGVWRHVRVLRVARIAHRAFALGGREALASVALARGGRLDPRADLLVALLARRVRGPPESHKWVEMQLNGTMDIDCPRWLDWFHGGLQFQTEHHRASDAAAQAPRASARRW